MRSFRLVNDTGDIWPLDGEDGIYFLSPEGLGYNESVSAGKVVNGFSKKTHSEISWPNLTGTLYITKMYDAKSAVKRSSTDNSKDGVYDTYLKFTDFLINAKNLYFDYNPYYGTEGSEYARSEVALMSIDKSEIVEGDTLQCKMTLARLTPWYYEELVLDSQGKKRTEDLNIILKETNRLGAKIDSCFLIELDGPQTPDGLHNVGLNISLHEASADNSGGYYKSIASCVIKPFAGGSVRYSSKYNDVYVLENGINIIDKLDISKQILLRVDTNAHRPDTNIHLAITEFEDEGIGWYDCEYKIYRYDYYRSV